MEDSTKGEDMRFFPVFLTLLLVVTACAPVAPGPADVAPQSQAVVINGSFETSLLATEWKGRLEGNVLALIDPASGAALPGYTPISLGQSSFQTFSPERDTLAV